MKGEHQRNVAPDGCCVAGAVQQLYAILLGSARQCPLFPKRIGWTVELNDVHVGGVFYTTVFARLHKYEVFVACPLF